MMTKSKKAKKNRAATKRILDVLGPPLKFKKLPEATIARIQKEMPKRMAEMERDEHDRRCLRGKYAPETGRCVGCGGTVVGVIRFAHSDRIGGPPVNAHVAHWACQDCGLMYQKTPPAHLAFDPFERKRR